MPKPLQPPVTTITLPFRASSRSIFAEKFIVYFFMNVNIEKLIAMLAYNLISLGLIPLNSTSNFTANSQIINKPLWTGSP